MHKNEITWVSITSFVAILACLYVSKQNPDLRIDEVAALKLFYLSTLNIVVFTFISALRGSSVDIFAKITKHAISTAVFVGLYAIAVATVIGK